MEWNRREFLKIAGATTAVTAFGGLGFDLTPARAEGQAAKLKFTIYQGATFRKRLTWKGPLPAQTPIDLTGCAARMQVRPEVESSTVLLELTTANGGITLGGVAGTIELFISDDASTLFTWTAGVWDLEIEFPGGDVRRLAQGSISVSPEVTRG